MFETSECEEVRNSIFFGAEVRQIPEPNIGKVVCAVIAVADERVDLVGL